HLLLVADPAGRPSMVAEAPATAAEGDVVRAEPQGDADQRPELWTLVVLGAGRVAYQLRRPARSRSGMIRLPCGLLAGELARVRLPAPGIGAHFLDAAACRPSQQLARPARVRVADSDITRAPSLDAIGNGTAAGLCKGFDHFHHAVTASRAEVEGHQPIGHSGKRAQRRDMPPCQVDDVDVVANPGTVGGGVVV